MSNYSAEISGIIDHGIDKSIKSISDILLDYGKFTYNSKDIARYRNKLTFYTTLENFLEEYVEGDEQMNTQDLLTIARISTSSVKLGGNIVGTSNIVSSLVTVTNSTVLKVNGESIHGVYLARLNEIIDLDAIYVGSGTVEQMSMTISPISVIEEKSPVYIKNYRVEYIDNLIKEVTVSIKLAGVATPLVTVFAVVIVDYDTAVPEGFDYTYPAILS